MHIEPQLIALLRLVFAKADLNSLAQSGLRYSQISQLLDVAILNDLISVSKGVTTVTPKGISIINSKTSGNDGKKGNWIRPLDEYRIQKIKPNTVYLPKKSTLRRLKSVTSTSDISHREDESSS